MSNPDNDDQSWCLFDDEDFFTKVWDNNFEEIEYIESSLNSSSSYEVIDDLRDIENRSIEVKFDIQEIPLADGAIIENASIPSKREIQDSLSKFIQDKAEELLNSSKKQEEIKEFEKFFPQFNKWLIEKKKQKLSPDLEELDPETNTLSCKFFVHNKKVNPFVLPFSDVYVNIVVNKQSHKQKVQSLFTEFIKETSPQSVIKESDSKNKNSYKKLFFQFTQGGTKFIITAGFDFRLRLNQYLQICANMDERFTTLGAFLSYWANQRNILSQDYLNPSALYYMLIYFMMTRKPPLLPKLREEDFQKLNFPKSLFSNYKKQEQSLIDYHNKSIKITNIHQENLAPKQQAFVDSYQASLGELLKEFFHMFAFEVPKLRKALSIKTGTPLTKKHVRGYSIEDPFNPQYDLCKNMNHDKSSAYQLVKKEMERAFHMLMAKDEKMDELCQERKSSL